MILNLLVRAQRLFGAAALVLMPLSLYMVFIYAPTEATMGHVQRIFYYHVASAWNGFLFFGLVAAMSGAFLITKNMRWNHAAKTAGELGVLFTTLCLMTGSLWARPIWNVWWTWDPRLTTTLILWFIYVAYLLIQSGAETSLRQKRFAAVFGIIGFLDIPLIHYSARLWRSIHPSVIQRGDPGMPPEMFATLIVSVLAFTAMGLFLWGQRFQLEELKERVDLLKERVMPL